MKHDLVIKGGTLVTASETFIADIGINGEKIVTLGESLNGYDEINAEKKLVMPGGIEAHCHIAQESGMGVMTSDDYETGLNISSLRWQFFICTVCCAEKR
jgi:dihydropyrimidinase